MYRRNYNIAALFGLILSGAIFACGPSFPNSYLTGSDSQLLQATTLSFEDEIRRIEVEIDEESLVCSPTGGWTSRNRVIDIDISEMRQALEATVSDSDQVEQTVNAYGAIRRKIEDYKNRTSGHQYNPAKREPIVEPNLPSFSGSTLERVPEEFALYLVGTYYYRTRALDKAVETWQKILELPAYQRHYRTTWAAFMIGKCAQRKHQESDREKARQMYQKVRQFVRDGFADSLDLAAASYGDEAATWLVKDHYDKAIELYLVQTLTNNEYAMSSLQSVCRTTFYRHKQIDMDALVQNRMVREVLLAYALSSHRKFDVKENGNTRFVTSQQVLLDAIEEANLFGVGNADRFAMAAYRAGDYEQAERWVYIADMDSLITRRIRAKLSLRNGDIQAAAEDLAFIARQTDSGYHRKYDRHNRLDNSRKLHSELGSLYLSRRMYTQAVDALMKGGNWNDAAYIAERVLTLEELQSYVDSTWPVSMLEPISDEDGFGPEGIKAAAIRSLLARRLSRLGQYEQAHPYYPNTQKDLLKDFDTFTGALSKGQDESLSKSERADAYWTAAWLMRHKGMEFMGTELSPDWYMYQGNYSLSDPLKQRIAALEKNGINIPTQEEIDRAKQNVSAFPNKRWHYRYFASDLAWEAAALMENEDPELARRLCLAGTWHRDRDNEYADVFYKSMVLRCGTTALGKTADHIRWFPKIPDTLVEEKPFELPEFPPIDRETYQ